MSDLNKELEELGGLELNEELKELGADQSEVVIPSSTKKSSIPQTIADMFQLGTKGATAGFKDELIAMAPSETPLPGLGLDVGDITELPKLLRGEISDLGGPKELTLDEKLKLYKEQKENIQRLEQEAQKRSPVLGTIAEIGGALAPLPLPSKILGAGKLVEKIPGMAKLGQKAKESYLLNIPYQTAKGALAGAEIGSIYGAGTSEASPFVSQESSDKFIKDILEGGETGLKLGGVLGGATSTVLPPVVGAVKKVLPKEEPGFLKAMKTVFKAERKAEKTGKPEEGILGRYEEARTEASKLYDSTLKNLEEMKKSEMNAVKLAAENKVFDTKNQLMEVRSELLNLVESPQRNQLLKDIEQTLGLIEKNVTKTRQVPVSKSAASLDEKQALKQAEEEFKAASAVEKTEAPSQIESQIIETSIPETKLGLLTKETPEGAQIVGKEVIRSEKPLMKEEKYTFSEKVDESEMTEPQVVDFIKNQLDPVIQDITVPKRLRDQAYNLKQKLRDRISEEVPGYAETMKKYHDVSSAEDVLAGQKFAGQMRSTPEKAKFLSDMASRIENSRDLREAKETIDMALNGFEFQGKKTPGLKEIDPELAAKFESEINRIGEKMEYSRGALDEIKRTTNVMLGALGGFQSVLTTVAGGAGRVVGATEKAVGQEAKNIKGLASKLIEKGPGRLTKMTEQEAQALVDQGTKMFGGAFNSTGNTLLKLAKMPEQRRQAYIYTLMQNPSARKMLSGLIGDEVEPEE